MKDSEFIALLNLYLDHEISTAEAARLESEVQANPARRKIYQQYCRMQKACKVLGADFATIESGAGSKTGKLIAFDPAAISAAAQKRKRLQASYTLGGLAAACVALVVINRSLPTGAASPEVTVSVAQIAPAAPVKAVEAAPALARGGMVSVAANRARTQPTLVADQLFLSSASTQTLLTRSTPDASNQLAWLTNLQLAPLPQRVSADELRFDAAPATLRPEARTLGGVRTQQTGVEVEMAAFRFVR